MFSCIEMLQNQASGTMNVLEAMARNVGGSGKQIEQDIQMNLIKSVFFKDLRSNSQEKATAPARFL